MTDAVRKAMGLPDEKPAEDQGMVIQVITKNSDRRLMTVDQFIAANRTEYGSAVFVKAVSNFNADDMDRLMEYEFSHALKSAD